MKPKVLFTASTFSHIASFHRPYLQAFRDLGWEVHIACGGPPRDIPEAQTHIALPLEKRMTAPANLRAQRQLRTLLRTGGYDLVICHTALAAFFTRQAAAGQKTRPGLICVSHGYLFDDATPAPRRTLLLTAERLCARQTDLLLTMNDYDEALARRWRLGSRVARIPGMGVDFAAQDAAAPVSRAEYGFGPEDFVLVYAAEFSPRKNQAMLLRAMPDLPERVKLLLPGDGALRGECQALAEQLELGGRVVFPGHVSPMAPLYAMSSAAVSASRSEGLPFHVMEAMHTGLPVVASRVKGHTDLLRGEEAGLLYDYDDAAGFTRAVTALLNAPERCRSMGEAARRAAAAYDLAAVRPQVMAQYLSLRPTPTPIAP